MIGSRPQMTCECKRVCEPPGLAPQPLTVSQTSAQRHTRYFLLNNKAVNMGDRGGAGASRPSLQHPSLVRSKAGGTYAVRRLPRRRRRRRAPVAEQRGAGQRERRGPGAPARGGGRRLRRRQLPLAAPRADEPALPLAALHTAGRRAGPGSRHGRRHALGQRGGGPAVRTTARDGVRHVRGGGGGGGGRPRGGAEVGVKMYQKTSQKGRERINSISDSFCPGVA